MRRSVAAGRRCARRAPRGAQSMLVTEIPRSAGRYTKPRLQGGKLRHAPAGDRVAQRAREGERKRHRRDGADGPVRAHVAPGEERHADRRRAAAPESRDEPDHRAGAGEPRAVRQRARRLRLHVEHHLRGDDEREAEEEVLEDRRRHEAREERAREHSGEQARCHAFHHPPVDGAVAVMRAQARERAREHRGERGADREVHHVLRREAVVRVHEGERGDDDDAAADAQQSREEADDGADGEVRGELTHRAARG